MCTNRPSNKRAITRSTNRSSRAERSTLGEHEGDLWHSELSTDEFAVGSSSQLCRTIEMEEKDDGVGELT